MALDTDVQQVTQSFGGPFPRELAAPHEPAQCLRDLDIDQMRHMKLVIVASEPRLNPCAEFCLQQPLEQG